MVSNLETFDKQHSSSICADSDGLAMETCSENEASPRPSDLFTQITSDRRRYPSEGIPTREKLLTEGDKVFVSQTHFCREIPGAVRTPTKKRDRGRERIASRRDTMAEDVTSGCLRGKGASMSR